MKKPEVIDVEHTELAVVPQQEMANLFGASNPADVIQRAREIAVPLAAVIQEQKLFTQIGKSKHVRYEGWAMLGSMVGVFPVNVWSKPLTDASGKLLGFEARSEARTRSGEVVGAAEAQCMRSEANWIDKDEFQLRSMAQTRAGAKALSSPLRFVMVLGGFNGTPAEEMGPAYKSKIKPKCPTCGGLIFPSKFQEGQWYCNKNKGGCGWQGDPNGETGDLSDLYEMGDQLDQDHDAIDALVSKHGFAVIKARLEAAIEKQSENAQDVELGKG